MLVPVKRGLYKDRVVDEGSFAARLLIVLLISAGMGANAWYQGRVWNYDLRFWHGAALGLPVGFLVAFLALD